MTELTPGQTARVTFGMDPRPDLSEDSELWQVVMRLTHYLDDGPVGAHEALASARCIGMRLVMAEDKLRIEPREDPTCATEWPRVRANLFVPNTEAIKLVLALASYVARVHRLG